MSEALIQYCVDQKLAGKSFSDLKTELMEKGILEAEILILFKEADNRVFEQIQSTSEKTFTVSQGFFGYALMVLGLVVTIFSIVLMNGQGFIFWYGPIFAGSGILLRLRNQKLWQTRDRIRLRKGSMWR